MKGWTIYHAPAGVPVIGLDRPALVMVRPNDPVSPVRVWVELDGTAAYRVLAETPQLVYMKGDRGPLPGVTPEPVRLEVVR